MKGFRWFPAILGGLLAGLVIYFLASMVVANPVPLVIPAAWLAVGYWAGRGGRAAWGRIWLVMAIACFALPLASVALSANVTAQGVSAAGSDAEAAGAVIGGALAGGLLTGAASFVGFFLGAIFAILAYFSLRAPRQSGLA